MLLLFITDLHTGLEGEYPHDIDLRQNFLDVLRASSRHAYDYLILGGDLCLRDGDSKIYRWQKKHLDKLGKPYYIIAGNHDNQKALQQVFAHLPLTEQSEIFYEVQLNDHQPALFLDTARGHLSDLQKAWLLEKVHEHQDQRLLIFMHHPPLLMSVPYMDRKYPLQDRQEVMTILDKTKNKKDIFCGHYHVGKSAFLDHMTVNITPSLFFQIDQYDEEFAVDHLQIGYRLINVEREKITSSIHYLPSNSK